MKPRIRPIHPFPARMAPEIAWKELPEQEPRLRVLDPMAGSGTIIVTARMRGHEALGFDRDPLAVTMASAWAANADTESATRKATEVLDRAQQRAARISESEAFPAGADDETQEFVRYWFDRRNRIQLAALSRTISHLHDPIVRGLMWCAMSRLIITKKKGVSLAMDVSHSRPHRTYDEAPIQVFDSFIRSVVHVTKALPFTGDLQQKPTASVEIGDARALPLDNESIDVVITSPPYLNAIDYLRGHKLALVWMGYTTSHVRKLRASNIGTEATSKEIDEDLEIGEIVRDMCPTEKLSSRQVRMLNQYVMDLREMMQETYRVLRFHGKAIVVVGNCNVRGKFVKNSRAVELVAEQIGFNLQRERKRKLPENRRYLPPPQSSTAGKSLRKRMREEVILTFAKL